MNRWNKCKWINKWMNNGWINKIWMDVNEW